MHIFVRKSVRACAHTSPLTNVIILIEQRNKAINSRVGASKRRTIKINLCLSAISLSINLHEQHNASITFALLSRLYCLLGGRRISRRWRARNGHLPGPSGAESGRAEPSGAEPRGAWRCSLVSLCFFMVCILPRFNNFILSRGFHFHWPFFLFDKLHKSYGVDVITFITFDYSISLIYHYHYRYCYYQYYCCF